MSLLDRPKGLWEAMVPLYSPAHVWCETVSLVQSTQQMLHYFVKGHPHMPLPQFSGLCFSLSLSDAGTTGTWCGPIEHQVSFRCSTVWWTNQKSSSIWRWWTVKKTEFHFFKNFVSMSWSLNQLSHRIHMWILFFTLLWQWWILNTGWPFLNEKIRVKNFLPIWDNISLQMCNADNMEVYNIHHLYIYQWYI